MPPMSSIDYSALREQLAGKEGVGYWRSLAELAETTDYLDQSQGEFADASQLWNAPLSRRSILKLLGASMALAGMAGCTRQPDEHIIPYVNMPEHQVPGRPKYYATTALVGGYAHGVLAESYEGRPVKLEGNPDHPATLGACDAIAQASVLSLYDPDRSAAVRREGVISRYTACLMTLQKRQSDWDASEGRGLCFLTAAVTSPSEQQHIEKLQQRWPRARWFMHEPVTRQSVFRGSELLFGKALEPRYRFDKAAVVVSLDADFLQSQPGFLRYARDFSARRRPRDHDTAQSRLYALESSPSITGASADHKRSLTWYEIEPAVRQLANELGLNVTPPQQKVLPDVWVQAIAEDLKHNKGAALLVPGEQQPPAVHAIAHAINDTLAGFGSTVEWITPVAGQGAEGLSALAQAVEQGQVDSLLIFGTNPVYSAPADLVFEELLQQVPWRLHWGDYYDETARLCHWHVPAAHALETWGDARAYDGTASLIQPLIEPLHGGKSALQMYTAIDKGLEKDPRELLRAYWQGHYAGSPAVEDQPANRVFEQFWKQSLHDGVVANSRFPSVMPSIRAGWQGHLPQPRTAPESALVLQFRPDPALWDGRYANNGWLQEMPRPLTTLTWDNAALISPRLAQQHNLEDGQRVELAVGERRLKVPVFVLPGHTDRAITLPLGYGRHSAGRVAEGVGSNGYRVRESAHLWATPVTLTATDEQQTLAAIQTHNNIEGRDLIRGASWDEYLENPRFAQHAAEELSLYPEPWPAQREASHAWGMAIDLSACIGCNGCVTACQSENNIPIVGPEEVSRGHDMHWIRVDRYFSGGLDSPGVTFQPVPCMHCENAPCEYVCPVGATQHSADGLNQMIYQRCVGTRYCSQNCPYKVRRFNWFDYTGSTAAYPAEPAIQNPDVTVRSRGVMEKCTYCVQRINTVRQDAETEGRPIADGELQTACQQSCPTKAIVFGDLADPDSEVNRLKASPLNYAMLEHLNTRPRTTYLAAVNNPNPALREDREDS